MSVPFYNAALLEKSQCLWQSCYSMVQSCFHCKYLRQLLSNEHLETVFIASRLEDFISMLLFLNYFSVILFAFWHCISPSLCFMCLVLLAFALSCLELKGSCFYYKALRNCAFKGAIEIAYLYSIYIMLLLMPWSQQDCSTRWILYAHAVSVSHCKWSWTHFL